MARLAGRTVKSISMFRWEARPLARSTLPQPGSFVEDLNLYLGRMGRRLMRGRPGRRLSIWNCVVGVNDELGRDRVLSGQVIRSVTLPYPTS